MSGNPEMFQNELQPWTGVFWNLKKKKKQQKDRWKKWAHAKTEIMEVFGSLCNVLLFWLRVKMLDFWKQLPNSLEYVAEYLGEGGKGEGGD